MTRGYTLAVTPPTVTGWPRAWEIWDATAVRTASPERTDRAQKKSPMLRMATSATTPIRTFFSMKGLSGEPLQISSRQVD